MTQIEVLYIICKNQICQVCLLWIIILGITIVKDIIEGTLLFVVRAELIIFYISRKERICQ